MYIIKYWFKLYLVLQKKSIYNLIIDGYGYGSGIYSFISLLS